MKHPPIYAYLPSASGAATMATMSECRRSVTGQETAPETDALDDVEPGEYRPRRLSILDLLLWMTVAAVLMRLRMACRSQSPEWPNVPVLGAASDVLFVICGAACLVGSGRIIWDKARRAPGRLQPGHWGILLCAGSSLWALPIGLDVRQWGSLLPLPDYSEVPAFHAVVSSLMAMVAVSCARRTSAAMSWRLVFAFFALHCLTWIVLDIITPSIRGCPFRIASYSLADAARCLVFAALIETGLFMLLAVVAMASDVLHRRRRDHLHWIGMGVLVLKSLWLLATDIVLHLSAG